MGQQQLFLVILVTIVVGIATVISMNVFETSASQANVDAVRQDVIQIAASAQQYYMKPVTLEGGGRNYSEVTFNDFRFASAGVTPDGLAAQNENARYVIHDFGTESFTITAHPASDLNYSPGSIENGLLNGGSPANNTIEAIVYSDQIEWVRSFPGSE